MNWFSQRFARSRMDDDLQQEIRQHLDEKIEGLMAEGISRTEAERRARVAFGNATVIEERSRLVWMWPAIESILSDIRFAARQLRKAPGFALTAVLTLALGIGANLAIFSILNALLLESLPVHDPDSLVHLAARSKTSTVQFGMTDVPMNLNLPIIEQIEQRARSFDGVFGWAAYAFGLQESDASRSFPGALVGGDAFRVLGVHPAAGRLLTALDDRPGGGPDGWAAVLSYGFWLEHYGASPDVVGRHVRLSDQSVTIVGVAPRGFEGIELGQHPDLFLPLEFETAVQGPRSMLHSAAGGWLITMARLRPGVSRTQASVEMDALWPGILDATTPPQVRHKQFIENLEFEVSPGRSGWSYLRLVYARPLAMMQAMVGIVLLLCCANLAGLCLARATARQQEFSIRGALGAARWRLLRQVLVENAVLTLPGALLGILFAQQADRILLPFVGQDLGDMRLTVHPGYAVVLVAAGCSVLAAALFGILPALLAARSAPSTVMAAATRQSGRRGWIFKGDGLARQIFLPLQIALSLVLVIVSTLMASTLGHLRNDNIGFHADGVYLGRLDFFKLPLTPEQLAALNRSIVERVAQMPGIVSASAAENTPLNGALESHDFAALTNGAQNAKPADMDANEITGRYFETMGTRFLQGRDFNNSEADANSCIVNQTAARWLFGSVSPVSRSLRRFDISTTGVTTSRDCQVVGVVEDAKYDSLREDPPATVYTRFGSNSHNLPGMTLVIRARSMADARNAYAKTMRELGRGSPQAELTEFSKQVESSIARERLMSLLSSFFALLALILSAIGIYGVMNWSVAQRTGEIGIRMALGASRHSILRGVLGQVLWLGVAGVVAGGMGAFFAAQSLRSLLWGVEPANPIIFGLSAVVLAATVLLSAFFPARRAASVDPMQALRSE